MGLGSPQTDHKGRICVANQMSRVFDDRFPKNDSRHKVATLHRHITASGEIGFAGKADPKRITTPDGIEYSLMPPHSQKCDLCESGDMISPWSRFLFSKYCPGTKRHHVWWKMAKRKFGQFRAVIRV